MKGDELCSFFYIEAEAAVNIGRDYTVIYKLVLFFHIRREGRHTTILLEENCVEYSSSNVLVYIFLRTLLSYKTR